MKLRREAGGLHAFDRTTGINVLIDEVTFEESKCDRSPRYTAISLTNRCDLSCAYCYAPKNRATLSRDQVVSWCEELDRHGCLGVGFGGGEPTLHNEFASICRDVAAKTRLAVSFTTHGHHVTREMVESLRCHVHFVRVSVDGVGDTYTRLRGRSYSGLLTSLAVISDLSPFGINVVVNSRTVACLDEIADLCLQTGASQLLLLPERFTDNTLGIDAESMTKLCEWVRNGPSAIDIAVSAEDLDSRLLATAASAGDENSYAHVDAQGRLGTSSYTDNRIEIGPSIIEAMDLLKRRSEP